MNQIKKSILPFLAVMAMLVLLLDFGGREVKYEQLSPEHIPETFRAKLPDQSPGTTGVVKTAMVFRR